MGERSRFWKAQKQILQTLTTLAVILRKDNKYLAVIVPLFYWSNFTVCDYFYFNDEVQDLMKWYGLKHAIYEIQISLLLFIVSFRFKRFLRLVLQFVSGIIFNDFLDRLFFDSRTFETNDFIILSILLMCLLIKIKGSIKSLIK